MRSIFQHIHHSIEQRLRPVEYARSIGVTVGDRCRLLNITNKTFGSEPYLITIGEHVTVTSGVQFITHDGGVWVLRDAHPTLDVIQPIKVGNNVFIGINTILLPGVTVGDNVILAAGAVVTKHIPSNTVAAGVPARAVQSIETYAQKALSSGVPTKGYSPTEKRRFLEDRFAADHAKES
ncbi:acyltransferase [Pseudactinotalea terrae]|uniref:acyltransferase n=1 Tax=Pseudactinotalea terrae TaxID=1743262 RepID=UPI0012E1EDAF|nr:acyltransferase [Pseudactinotalea terrae]